jgi:hypothetical protein
MIVKDLSLLLLQGVLGEKVHLPIYKYSDSASPYKFGSSVKTLAPLFLSVPCFCYFDSNLHHSFYMTVASSFSTANGEKISTTTGTATTGPASSIPTNPVLKKSTLFPIQYPSSPSNLSSVVPYPSPPNGIATHSKRKKAKDATSVGGSTAIARTLMLQGLVLFYRTPIKVFPKVINMHDLLNLLSLC